MKSKCLSSKLLWSTTHAAMSADISLNIFRYAEGVFKGVVRSPCFNQTHVEQTVIGHCGLSPK